MEASASASASPTLGLRSEAADGLVFSHRRNSAPNLLAWFFIDCSYCRAPILRKQSADGSA